MQRASHDANLDAPAPGPGTSTAPTSQRANWSPSRARGAPRWSASSGDIGRAGQAVVVDRVAGRRAVPGYADL
jgi:hypothetical protein